MGSCRNLLKLSSCVVVALLGVLIYFHLECLKEKEEKMKNKTNPEFNPEVTDCTVEFKYTKKGKATEFWLGMQYFLIQSFPCSVTKLVIYVNNFIDNDKLKVAQQDYEKHNVTIVDARKVSPGHFHETGFTLITLDKEPITTDWRSSYPFSEDPDIRHFHEQMEPYIKKLYPDTKKVLWTYNIIRGGDKFGDQPRADSGPHLDFYQDIDARIEFHNEYPELDSPVSESKMLMGKFDEEDLEMKVMLGVWKPISPAKVCDYPLAVMDARTFKPEYISQNKIHIQFLPGMTIHNLNGAISYDEAQKWYYFSFQTPMEVLIFHHYSKGKWFNNPHSSFLNKNCPKDSEERVSVELRVGLYF